MAEPVKKVGKVNYHYIKNPLYREVHIDGALGGLTPRKYLSINFYAERGVVPKSEEVPITPDGKQDRANRKISADSKQGIIREIEVGMYMDIEAAKELKNWLDLKIKEYDKYFSPK